MKRRRLKLFTVISLLLLAGCVFLWARSVAQRDEIGFMLGNGRLRVGSEPHRLSLTVGLSLSDTLDVVGQWGRRAGDDFELRQLLPSTERSLLARRVLIPYWMIILPWLIAPVLFLRRWRPGRAGSPRRRQPARRNRRRRNAV